MKNNFDCRDSAKKLWNNSFELLNFRDEPDKSVKHINQFIENITKNNIKDVVQLSDDTQKIQFAIVNAAYFKGLWVRGTIFNFQRAYFDFNTPIPRNPILIHCVRIGKNSTSRT